MTGLAWLDVDEACDLLRVDADNAALIETYGTTIPYYIEVVTGYPAACAMGVSCDETVKQLARFLLQLWFNPDGTDADQLRRIIASLTATVKALVIHSGDEA